MRGPNRRGRGGGQEPPPPNYRAIAPSRKLVPAASEDRRRHDRLAPSTVSGWLELEFELVDHLHVGAGAPALYDQLVKASVVHFSGDDEDMVPIVPGASIKGAARNLAELLLGGGAPDDRDIAETAVGGLFGYIAGRQTFASRIGIDDAYPVSDEPALGVAKLPRAFQPRKAAGRRLYGRPRGTIRREIPHEVVPKGERFRTRLHFVNVTNAELGVVLICLGMDRKFHLRIGGGKFAGFGRVSFTAQGGMVRRGYDQPRPDTLDLGRAGEFVGDCLEAANEWLPTESNVPRKEVQRILGSAP